MAQIWADELMCEKPINVLSIHIGWPSIVRVGVVSESQTSNKTRPIGPTQYTTDKLDTPTQTKCIPIAFCII